MNDFDLIDPTEPLERQNEKLKQIALSLIRRVEQDTGQTGDGYSLFQRAIALESEVRARTSDLHRAMAELKRVNDELEAATAVAEEANRAKSRILAAVSHDLLQPLNAAKLFVGMLEETGLNAEQGKLAHSITSAFRSLDGLLISLLEITKLDSPKLAASPRPMTLLSVLQPIAQEFTPIAAAKGVELRIAPTSAYVVSDPQHLRSVVQNLVSNAVRYTQKGRVLIGARHRGDKIAVEVWDSGPGIEPEKIPEIFREFYRIDGGDASGEPGMGLGLAIVERACRLLHHDLAIRSKVGSGSCFSVSMPRASVKASVGSGAAPSLDGSLIAVVSASHAMRSQFVQLIEQWGASVVSGDSETAIYAALDELGVSPDIALLDETTLGRAPADELAAELRRRGDSQLRVVRVAPAAPAAAAVGRADPVVAAPVRVHRLRAILSYQWTEAKGAGEWDALG